MKPVIHITTRNNVLSGEITPQGVLTPDYKGQFYLRNDGILFLANDITNDSWVEISSEIILNDSIDSTSITEAATANAVRKAYEKAEAAFQSASNGKNLIASAITGMGVEASSNEDFNSLSTKISKIKTKAIFS